MTAATLDGEENVKQDVADDCPRPDGEERTQSGWAARLVQGDPSARWDHLGRTLGAGLALSALYGVALGARQGGLALFQHALGVPLGFFLVALAGAPSVFIFLSMCRAPIDALSIGGNVARAVASAGLVLAGLAPAAALFVVSSETPQAASGAVTIGLLMGGGVGLGRMMRDVVRPALIGRVESVFGGATVALGFAVFAVTLATRVWTSVLPILGGAS